MEASRKYIIDYYRIPSFDGMACLMSDEGFSLIFTNGNHSRWFHDETELLVDVWLSRKGITLWRHRGRSRKHLTVKTAMSLLKYWVEESR